jgi:hypothetical protein
LISSIFVAVTRLPNDILNYSLPSLVGFLMVLFNVLILYLG